MSDRAAFALALAVVAAAFVLGLKSPSPARPADAACCNARCPECRFCHPNRYAFPVPDRGDYSPQGATGAVK